MDIFSMFQDSIVQEDYYNHDDYCINFQRRIADIYKIENEQERKDKAKEYSLYLPTPKEARSDVRICEEPYLFINKPEFKKNAGNMVKYSECFAEYAKENFSTIVKCEENQHECFSREEIYNQKMWFNSTKKGINLRPGRLDNENSKPYAICMGDELVHGIVAGQTGGGKSVFLNNLIFNLIMEYAPWELDLYLMDFKMVEFSRYMSKSGFETPHIKACAATSEIRYVLSLFRYIVDCMKARQTLFQELGIQKLEDFRDRYEVVLPRVLLIVDEFQQMFLEATANEQDEINDLILALTKLGRATGFHLLFASQDMGNAMSGDALANFKIRFALKCDKTVSAGIIGNSAAGESDFKIGYVICNTGSGKVEENQLFRTPYIPAEEDAKEDERYFYKYLKKQTEALSVINKSNKQEYSQYFKIQKYYKEDAQKDFEILERYIENKNYQCIVQNILNNNQEFKAVFMLGSPVVFNAKKRDYESFFLEQGDAKNILIISPSLDDVAYVQRLLATNLKCMKQCKHYFYSFNKLLAAKADFESVEIFKKCHSVYDFSDSVKKIVENAKMISDLYTNSSDDEIRKFYLNHFVETVLGEEKEIKEEIQQFIKQNDYARSVVEINRIADSHKKEIVCELSKIVVKNKASVIPLEVEDILIDLLNKDYGENKKFKIVLGNYDGKNPLNECSQEIVSALNILGIKLNPELMCIEPDCFDSVDLIKKYIICCALEEQDFAGSVEYIVDKKKCEYESGELLPKRFIWVLGSEMLNQMDVDLMRQATNYNVYFIVCSTTKEVNADTYSIFKAFDYRFVGGNNRDYYDKAEMPYTKKDKNSIVIDFGINSLQTYRSFKKYRLESVNYCVPEIDFDDSSLDGVED